MSQSQPGSPPDKDVFSAQETRKRNNQFARKSTGGQPPRKRVKSDDSELALEENEKPYFKPTYARKSTGGKAPPKPRLNSSQPSSSSHSSQTPPISASANAKMTTCGLCSYPPIPTPASSDEIPGFTTLCGHYFHYGCYMNKLLTTPFDLRKCCPTCSLIMTRNEVYWVQIESGGAWTNISQAVEDRFVLVRQAKQQIFLDMLNVRNLPIVIALLEDPEPVDVNLMTREGFTALHLRAMANDLAGVDLLLRHGANREIKSGVGLTALEYANQNNANQVVGRLMGPD
ncbi:hypothetical protein MIND_00547600 [Mycena indigotica]|uniref:RING-type domain-containing protein n=1 Tax=Mycena indigotica TaxID=2126181 RepID=A0A8H6SX12_9AGAR|nr:uncharacterized protein MIND_00547600 [Mycena indigotica]KAF7307528.1 hypothetical protein MIND_00547600 [Mycena indigotica]